MDKDPGIYVRHILDALTNIEMDTAGYDFEKFRKDRRARQLLERALEILSEASRRLPKELEDLEAHIPWRAVAGIGNILRHDYHETYPTALWDTQLAWKQLGNNRSHWSSRRIDIPLTLVRSAIND